MSLTRPNPFLSKWAENGKRFDVPDNVSDTANGKANIQAGFPEITMKSVLNGGVPPWGQDMNGVLYRLSEANQWTQAGGLPVFNQDLCNSINGYPVGTLLQTNDSTRPWVMWLNLKDNNSFNPDLNAISKIGEQNGWVRFPVISEDDGNIQYYDENGKSIAASPSVATSAYVSFSLGSDLTGLGTRANPYKTIIKAIRELPSAGTANIYIMAEDTHDCSAFDDTMTLLQYINLSSMNIQFIPYSNNQDTQNLQDTAIKHFENTISDGGYGYCISNLVRPTIKLHWSLFENGSQYFCGFYGTDGIFSIKFFGLHFEIDRVDELSNLTTPMASSWLWNGGNYLFCGCTWGKLPYITNDTGVNFIQGWSGAVGKTQINFLYRNYFSDSIAGNSVFFGTPRSVTVNVEDYITLTTEQMGGFTFIESNSVDFLCRNEVFNNTLYYIYNPSKNYKGLSCNQSISGVS